MGLAMLTAWRPSCGCGHLEQSCRLCWDISVWNISTTAWRIALNLVQTVTALSGGIVITADVSKKLWTRKYSQSCRLKGPKDNNSLTFTPTFTSWSVSCEEARKEGLIFSFSWHFSALLWAMWTMECNTTNVFQKRLPENTCCSPYV